MEHILEPSDSADARKGFVEVALIFRTFALEHPALFAIAFDHADPAISPRFRSARLDALAVLHKRFEPLADADLLGGRSVPEAATQFGALGEGLAWTDLRCNPLPPNPEQFWRSAFHALITGFAAPAPRPPRRTSRARGRTVVASPDNWGWSLYGAQRGQPMAIGGEMLRTEKLRKQAKSICRRLRPVAARK
jgi:hypothetical protein